MGKDASMFFPNVQLIGNSQLKMLEPDSRNSTPQFSSDGALETESALAKPSLYDN